MRSIIVSNQPYVSVVFVLLTALYQLPHFWLSQEALAEPETYAIPLPQQFIWVWILSAVSITLGGITINRVVNQKEFHDTNSSLPGLVYIIVASAFTYFGGNLSLLVANLALIQAFDIVSRIFRQPRILHESFAGSFWMGVASLFFFPLLLGMATVLSVLTITRTFNWREYLVGIIGFLVPWLWYESFLYIFDWEIPANIVAVTRSLDWQWTTWVIVSLFSLFTLAGLVSVLRSFSGSTNKSRNAKSIALTFSSILGFALLIASSFGFAVPVYLMCLPVALILPYYFLTRSYSPLHGALVITLLLSPFIAVLHLLNGGL
ncbi:MAG: hypothetical protein HKN32_06055 [Flavobacteriales bacterium]|nr:hypothetical protein [Flavobacteriales bacterium]